MTGIVAQPPVPPRLKRFIWDVQSMAELAESEREILVIGRDLMARLVACDDWLPAIYALPDPARHQQFALYADGMERFSVVATILAEGQILPVVLDPTWEIMGVLRGAVSLARFTAAGDGGPVPRNDGAPMTQGMVATFPAAGRDALRLGNVPGNGTAIVVHVHGGEMTTLARRTFFPDGRKREGPVAYANAGHAPPYDIFSIQTRIEH